LELRIARHLLQYRFIYGVFSLLFCIATGLGIGSLQFSADPRSYFEAENRHLIHLEANQALYGNASSVTYVVEVQEGDVFTSDNLVMIEAFTQAAANLPYAQRIDSLTNYSYTYSSNDELSVEPFIENAASLNAADIANKKQLALTDASIVNRLVDKTGKAALVNVLATFPEEQRTAVELEIAAAAHQLAEQFEQRYPQMDILLTGTIINSASINNTIYADTVFIIPLMYLLIFVLLAVLLRSIVASLIIALITTLSCIATMGLAAETGYVLNMLSITALNIIITVSIADSVHVLVIFLKYYRQGKNKIAAMTESLRINLMPCFITSLTTAIGFLSMNLSSMPPAHDLGNITAMGVVIAFVFSLTILPVCALILPCNNKAVAEENNRNMHNLGQWVIRYQKALLFSTFGFSLLMLSLVPFNTINDKFTENLKPSSTFRMDNEKIDGYFGGLYNIEYSFNAQEGGSISNPEYLHALDNFTQWLRQQPEVRNVYVYTDTLKRMNQTMHNNEPAWYRIPDTQEEAAQYLLLLDVAQSSNAELDFMVLPDKSASRLIVSLPSIDSKTMIAMHQRFAEKIKADMPAYMHDEGTSLSLMWAYLGEPVLNSSIQGALLALVIISITLMIIFKSVRYGLISLIPNLFPAAIGYGFWALYNGNLDLSQMVIMSLTIGIVVDDTIHFLSKYLRVRREQNLNSRDAVLYTFEQVGSALWITTSVLAIGFGLLVFSSFIPNINLGILTSIILVAALVLDGFLLPPLLMWFDRDRLDLEVINDQ
jgi:uncharacterized protein